MFKAEIKAHSVDEQGNELLTVSCTFPRIIVAEMNTHRMLSKNTSSSRAIPGLKMIEIVKTNPVIPIGWQKKHSGMQGTQYISHPDSIALRELQWLNIRDKAVVAAESLSTEFSDREDGEGVTKQLTNRLLEPFMWTTMLITGPVKGGWDNFFKLRNPVYEIDLDNLESLKD